MDFPEVRRILVRTSQQLDTFLLQLVVVKNLLIALDADFPLLELPEVTLLVLDCDACIIGLRAGVLLADHVAVQSPRFLDVEEDLVLGVVLDLHPRVTGPPLPKARQIDRLEVQPDHFERLQAQLRLGDVGPIEAVDAVSAEDAFLHSQALGDPGCRLVLWVPEPREETKPLLDFGQL